MSKNFLRTMTLSVEFFNRINFSNFFTCFILQVPGEAKESKDELAPVKSIETIKSVSFLYSLVNF